MINEKRVIYDHKVDQKNFKWSGKSKLQKIENNNLPSYVKDNIGKYKDWLI